MKSRDYWKTRAKDIEEASHQSASKTAGYVDDQYVKAMAEIEKEINNWFQKFAANNSMTMAEARKVLSSSELKAFKMDLKDYIAAGEKLNTDMDPAWIKKLKSASAVHHIERLEALKIRTQQACEVLYGSQLGAMNTMVKGIYADSYYNEMFTLQKGLGVGWQVNTLDEKKLTDVIKKPWAPDGEAFSSRIWKNRTKLVNELHTEITQSCVTGKSVDDMTKVIQKKMGVSDYNARRLVQTEASHFNSAGTEQSYADTGVKQYQYMSAVDDATCGICGDMDGQIFDLSEYEEGVTAPPLHPSCRCTTAPYFNDEFTVDNMRAVKDEGGKTFTVPADTTYKDWKKKHVK
jgi:SPP1 gp7 family putative phage head morphogenesis protein